MRFSGIIEPTQVPVREDSVHVHKNVHVFGHDDLLILETLVEDTDGRREGEPSDGVKGHTIKEGPQIVEFIDT